MANEPPTSGEVTSVQRLQTWCLVILAVVATGAALTALRPVLIPFVLALFFYYLLEPLVEIQSRRLRLPRVLGVSVAFFLGSVSLFLLALLISASIQELSGNAETYHQNLSELLERVESRLPEGIFEYDREQLVGKVEEGLVRLVRSTITGVLGELAAILSQGLLVLIFLLFLLLGRQDSPPARGFRADVERRVRGYIGLKVAISVVTGVLVGGVLGLLGVQLAFVFGVLAFFLNFIPSIGSIVATLLPLPMVLLDPGLSLAAQLAAVAGPGLIQFLVGNVIEPRVIGRSLDLHAITVLLALIFFGMIWGIVGMLLAVPLTSATKIVFERHPFTRPVADLLAGRFDDEAPTSLDAP